VPYRRADPPPAYRIPLREAAVLALSLTAIGVAGLGLWRLLWP